jgi:hypothetical protein
MENSQQQQVVPAKEYNSSRKNRELKEKYLLGAQVVLYI